MIGRQFSVPGRVLRKILLSGFLLLVPLLMSGCASCMHEYNVYKGEQAEQKGEQGDAFYPYFNSGKFFADQRDFETARHWYLRAYRNTKMMIPYAPEPKRKTLERVLIGDAADWFRGETPEKFAEALDPLTPLPGTGAPTNEVVPARYNDLRSMACYEWARMSAYLGKFDEAEVAFRYSLFLDTRANRRNLFSGRYFNLARVSYALGKVDESINYYHKAFEFLGEDAMFADVIGYANCLDEFAAVLEDAGKKTEAEEQLAKSKEIRLDNPGKVAKAYPEPYPIRKPAASHEQKENSL